MSKIIVFSVRKGGEGKTTLSTNQAGLLAKTGKTLIIDLDQQGHVIKSFGYNPSEIGEKNIVSVLKNEISLDKAMLQYSKNLDILASNSKLSSYLKETGANKKIRNLINDISKSQKYKYIVIDTAPAFDDLSWELMDLANLVCIPYSCKGYANEAVSDMVNSESLKDFRMNNKNLGICIIPNRYKVIARKGEESKNSSYKILLDDIKEKIKTFKNVFVSNLISYSDQYDTAMQFEQVPLTLANPSKLNRNLKAYAKPIEEQKELSKTIIKLLGGKK